MAQAGRIEATDAIVLSHHPQLSAMVSVLVVYQVDAGLTRDFDVGVVYLRAGLHNAPKPTGLERILELPVGVSCEIVPCDEVSRCQRRFFHQAEASVNAYRRGTSFAMGV